MKYTETAISARAVSRRASSEDGQPAIPLPDLQSQGYDPPQIVNRDATSTRAPSQQFGRQLAAKAWSLDSSSRTY